MAEREEEPAGISDVRYNKRVSIPLWHSGSGKKAAIT
jgi:hypothetical protein